MLKGKYVRNSSHTNSPAPSAVESEFQSPIADINVPVWKRYLPMFLIVILTAFVYSFSLDNHATNWDDDKYIDDNSLLKTLDKETVKKMFFSDDPKEKYFMGNYHPLTMLTLNLNYQIAEIGANGKALPYTFIIINITLHLLSCFLVYLIFSQLFTKRLYPIVITLLFGIHTLHVESVTWIAERKDVLYTMFFFLSLYCYILYKKQHNVLFYITSIIVFFLSALSKGQAVSLTITLFLVDYFLTDDYLKPKTHLNKIPFFAISIYFGLISIEAQAVSDALAETDQYEPYQRIAFGSNGFLQYILRFILPVKLACLYPYPDIVNRTVPMIYWLTVPIFIVFLLLSFFTYKKSKTFTFGLLFYVVNIALLLQFIPVGSAMYADRYSYIPSIGLSVLLAYGLDLLLVKFKDRDSLIYGVFAAYALILCVLTVQRQKVWHDSETLWTDCVSKYPEAVIGWNNLGSQKNLIADSVYKKVDDSKYLEFKKSAIDCFTNGIKYKPDYTHCFYNRGLAEIDVFEHTNDTSYQRKAFLDFCEAIKYDSDFAPAFHSRASIYDSYSERFGKQNPDSCSFYFSLAIFDFERALDLNPKLIDVYVNRGVAYGKYMDFSHAIEDFNKYISEKTDNPSVYSNRGLAYNGLRQYDKALEDFERALSLDSLNEGAYFNRSLTYRNLSEISNKNENLLKAIQDVSKCIQINPNSGYYYYLRALLNLNRNSREGVCEDLHIALEKNYSPASNLIQQFCNN
ncbi:MAG: tetratricopeptide repeat protein [Bacteroidales bacterium]|nr:tetratricopeptide repeat protein [Bacteroidales bacterium]